MRTDREPLEWVATGGLTKTTSPTSPVNDVGLEIINRIQAKFIVV